MLLLNMSNKLELSGLFVCLGQLIKFLSTSGDRKKNAGLRFARVISTQAGTEVYIYIGFPTGKDGGRLLPPAENLLILPTWENPSSRTPLSP